MATLSTDDDARRLRNVWLGPNGFEWGFAARYSAWGVAVGLFLVGSVVAWAALPALPFFVAGVPGAAALAVLATRRVMRHVTHDTPVSALMQTFRSELHAPRPADEPTEYVIALPGHTFAERRPKETRA